MAYQKKLTVKRIFRKENMLSFRLKEMKKLDRKLVGLV